MVVYAITRGFSVDSTKIKRGDRAEFTPPDESPSKEGQWRFLRKGSWYLVVIDNGCADRIWKAHRAKYLRQLEEKRPRDAWDHLLSDEFWTV